MKPRRARIEVYVNGKWVVVGVLPVPPGRAWKGAGTTLPAVAKPIK